MYIEVTYNGIVYHGKTFEDDTNTMEEIADEFYKSADEMTSFRLELDDGSILVLPKISTQSMAMRFYPTIED